MEAINIVLECFETRQQGVTGFVHRKYQIQG